jgi:polysaccharide deacetylase 2 family uncharacterized protein YibQ/multisubunit Na+/H+ antiporter MnhC subunit
VPKTVKPRQKKKPQTAKTHSIRKRRKKGVSPDIGHALLLTAVIIAVSVIVSVVVIGIKSSSASISLLAEDIIEVVPPILAEENPSAPKETPTPPEKIAVLTTPPEKAPVKPPPVSTPPAKPPTPKVPTPKETPTPKEKLTTKGVPNPPELPPQPRHSGTLVFIIDDAGNNLQELEPFLRFSGPLTIAVLPGLPHSAEAARRIRAAGKEVFLHQPMEAIGGQNPGPGAIYAGMSAAEIVAILSKNIAEIGPVAGMNNHQGSKITMDQQMMETVLAFCRERGICFLDSRTSAETAVPAAARKLGIKIGERNIFIDNDQNRPAMNRSIENGLTRASQAGSALMIGHTWSPELAPLLAERYQNFIAQGYELVTAAEFITKN